MSVSSSLGFVVCELVSAAAAAAGFVDCVGVFLVWFAQRGSQWLPRCRLVFVGCLRRLLLGSHSALRIRLSLSMLRSVFCYSFLFVLRHLLLGRHWQYSGMGLVVGGGCRGWLSGLVVGVSVAWLAGVGVSCCWGLRDCI